MRRRPQPHRAGAASTNHIADSEHVAETLPKLLPFQGVRSATARGLAIVSELVYGNAPSWKDPVKFSYAFGRKDGMPFTVDGDAMDEAAEIFKALIESAVTGNEKLKVLERLRRFVPRNVSSGFFPGLSAASSFAHPILSWSSTEG